MHVYRDRLLELIMSKLRLLQNHDFEQCELRLWVCGSENQRIKALLTLDGRKRYLCFYLNPFICQSYLWALLLNSSYQNFLEKIGGIFASILNFVQQRMT